MALASTFGSLGNQILSTHLEDFANLFTEYLPDQVEANPALKTKLESYRSQANVWQKKYLMHTNFVKLPALLRAKSSV